MCPFPDGNEEVEIHNGINRVHQKGTIDENIRTFYFQKMLIGIKNADKKYETLLRPGWWEIFDFTVKFVQNNFILNLRAWWKSPYFNIWNQEIKCQLNT